MAYKFKLKLVEPNKKPRIVNIKADNNKSMKDACNLLLPKGTKVTIIKKTKVK